MPVSTMRLHQLRHARLAPLFIAILVGSLLVLPATASAATQGCADDASGITDHTAAWEAQLLQLTNDHRTGMGLVALKLDTTLTRASVWKSRDMARRNYFSHDDIANGDAPARSPWERLTACGWTTGGSRAENIAAGYSSPAAVIQGWLNSPGHRANIENAGMRYVGFGVAHGASSSYGTYSTQMFASVAGPASTTPISQPPADDGSGGAGGSGSTDDGAGDGGTDGGNDGDDDSTDGGTRDPQGQGERATTTLTNLRSRVLRSRCSGRLAVNGWCYRIVVQGQASSDATGQRLVAIHRRTAAGRLVRMVRFTTTDDGRFGRVLRMRPPARNTALWLRRNATRLRVSVGGTADAAPTVSWTGARMLLRRR